MAAVCDLRCMNGGHCAAPDQCSCTFGYIGKHCHIGKYTRYRKKNNRESCFSLTEWSSSLCLSGLTTRCLAVTGRGSAAECGRLTLKSAVTSDGYILIFEMFSFQCHPRSNLHF